MGIKNLHPFLRKSCPLIYHHGVRLSSFAFHKIALDTSIFLCKFKTTAGSKWQEAFVSFVVELRAMDVHPIFVFDTAFPMEKDLEKQTRIDARNKMRERVNKVTAQWESVLDHTRGPAAAVLVVDLEQTMWQEKSELADVVRRVGRRREEGGEDSYDVSVADVEREIQRMQNACFVLRTEDFVWTRQVLDALGVPHVPAVGEAEATCAVLNRRGMVAAVLSEDTDVLAYGAPVFLHRINLTDFTVSCIEHDALLRALHLSAAQFLDFCIMCGTDYNTNIPRIGPDKSYRFLQRYGDIDHLLSRCDTLDGAPLKHHRVRQLFDTSFDISHLVVPYCGPPDLPRLRDICRASGINIDERHVARALLHSDSIDRPPASRDERPASASLLRATTATASAAPTADAPAGT